MTANPSDQAVNSPRLQALKRVYNVIRNGAPDTHIMILTPPGINDYATGTGLGNLAASFASLPGAVDWTKTSVAYHLYNNDSAYGAATRAANLRNLHSRYPAWPSENNFPASVSNDTLGITDTYRSAQFDDDLYVNQTCERLGLGWSMWNINGQAQLDHNWPILWADAVAKGWTWTADTLPSTAPVFTSPAAATFSQNVAGSCQITAATFFVNILPTQDTVLYSETFSAGNTANWFSYSGGSAGIAATLANEAAGPTDGRVLTLGLTAPNPGWYAGMGVTVSGAPPFPSTTLARTFLRARLQVVGPAAGNLSLVLKADNGQALTLDTTVAPGATWTDVSAPLSAFTNTAFNFAATSWQILIVPNSTAWAAGTFSLRLDYVQIVRRDDLTDPLQAWRKIYFGSPTASTGAYAPTADYDGDGTSNLLAYALGGDPTVPYSTPEPVVSLDTGNRLQLAFPCDATLTNISYTVQTSTDLARSTGGADTGANLRTVTVTMPTPATADPKRFLRLRVTTP